MDSYNLDFTAIELPAHAPRYKNGDRCPCCGQTLEGKDDQWLQWFSAVTWLLGFSQEVQNDGES